MAEIGEVYRGDWQREILRALCEHRYNVIKGPRQKSGKTHMTAVHKAARICLDAGRVGIGMPTMRSGTRILADRIAGMVYRWSTRHPEMKRDAKNANYMTWTKEGQEADSILVVVSLHEGSRASVQGFTFDDVIIDEGHECSRDIYDALEPTMDLAAQEERDYKTIIGIGSDTGEALIDLVLTPEFFNEQEEVDPDDMPLAFNLHHIQIEEIIKGNPRLAAFYRKKERSVPAHIWAQHYLTISGGLGVRRIYPYIADKADAANLNTRHLIFGIDVGKLVDKTVVTCLECRPSSRYESRLAVNLIDFIELPGSLYTDQAKLIQDYVYGWYPNARERPRGNVAIETNGPGEGLADILHSLGWDDIQRIRCSDRWKEWIIQEIQTGMREVNGEPPWIGVPNDFARDHLSKLKWAMVQSRDGLGFKTEYDHSDIHSSFITGYQLAA